MHAPLQVLLLLLQSGQCSHAFRLDAAAAAAEGSAHMHVRDAAAAAGAAAAQGRVGALRPQGCACLEAANECRRLSWGFFCVF